MFRHMAILKFKSGARREDIDAYFAAFPALMASLPVIRAWSIGRNEGTGGETDVEKHGFSPQLTTAGSPWSSNWPQAYRQYAEAAEQQAFFAKYGTPILAERVVCQFSKSTDPVWPA